MIVLIIVAVNAYRDKKSGLEQACILLLHPINADGLATTQTYIQHLSEPDFRWRTAIFTKLCQQFRGQPTYFYFRLGRELKQLPPKVPDQANILDVMLWSLKFRFLCMEQSAKK